MANKEIIFNDGNDNIFSKLPIAYRVVDLNSINHNCIFSSYDADDSRPPISPNSWILGFNFILPRSAVTDEQGYNFQICVQLNANTSYSLYVRRCYNNVWQPWKTITLN